MKIAILVGDNPYGTTVHFAKGLAKGLEAHGVSTRLFWIADGEFFHAFYALINDPPDLTCSFSDISLNGKPLGELWQIPHLSMLVDPPIYFLHQFQGKRSWVACVDHHDCTFVQELGHERCFFLPHGVDGDLKTPIERERPYEVAFFGTCLDYEEIERSLNNREKEVVLAASKRILAPDGIPILRALQELGIQDEELPYFHSFVDRYTRGKDRVELIRSLKGHEVHIWGDGPWKKYLPQVNVYPALDFQQTVKKMQECQVVLNSSPRFKAGSHERLFYASLCGAAVYTAENAFIKQHLPELETYRYGEWENVSFRKWKNQAAYAQQLVLEQHTYTSRAELIVQAFKSRWASGRSANL